MDKEYIKSILEKFKKDRITIDEVISKLKHLPYRDLGFAKIDTHRSIRHGFPEVVFCGGKTKEQAVKIILNLAKTSNVVLATRANKEIFKEIKKKIKKSEFNELARTILIRKKPIKLNKGYIAIVCAGTSDIPVAEEAVVTAIAMGNRVEKLYDVGVAGIHRVLEHRNKLDKANVIIVIAGMEGALASVVGGLVDKPVIAVPTSIGYGASFGGVSALLTMLNSCASNVAVVNIDNGFGAGYIGSIINRSISGGG